VAVQRDKMSMSAEEVRAYIANSRFGRLATADLGGQPHITPVAYVDWEDQLYIRVLRRSRRANHLAENPKVAMCIDDGVGPGDGYPDRRGVVISGNCLHTEQVSEGHPVERLFLDRHGVTRDHLWLPSHEWMVIVPERTVSWDFSKIPPGLDPNLDRERQT
jgi:hypothetical protein